MPISTLIVDDEPLAREGLRLLLAGDGAFGPIALARGGREAIAHLRHQRPDLVLLDVQMPEIDGFGVVAEIGAGAMPAVVFVTAHDQYAIAAFEISAVDYVLKPVTAARFALAMSRVKARLGAVSEQESARQALALRDLAAVRDPQASPRGLERVAVRDGELVRFVAIDEIEWFQGAENYVELHLCREPARTHLLQVTMNALERALDPRRFLRVHRSTIVALAHVVELRPIAHGEYQLLLTSGARVRSGRTYHERVKALLKNPF